MGKGVLLNKEVCMIGLPLNMYFAVPGDGVLPSIKLSGWTIIELSIVNA